MKKILLFAVVLTTGYATAQQGNVGINTDTPNATLEVKSKTGTTNATKNLELKNAANTTLVTVLDDGKVGIGTAVPTEKIEINGKIKTSSLTGTNVGVVVVSSTGVLEREQLSKFMISDVGSLTCTTADLGRKWATPDGKIECKLHNSTPTFFYTGSTYEPVTATSVRKTNNYNIYMDDSSGNPLTTLPVGFQVSFYFGSSGPYTLHLFWAQELL